MAAEGEEVVVRAYLLEPEQLAPERRQDLLERIARRTQCCAAHNVWLMTNYHMLTTGTVKLITALVELGEAHARA